MTGAQRREVQLAIDAEVRRRNKGKRGASTDKVRRSGSWIPLIRKVQHQHIFDAISRENGQYAD